jgi:hypothetical protein
MKFIKQLKLLTFQVIVSLIILNTQISFAQKVETPQITNLQNFFLGMNINKTSKKSESEDATYNDFNQTYSDDDNNISLTLTKNYCSLQLNSDL